MSGKKITYSTELMVNFKQVKAVSPQKKFQALQTADGYSLLFSIGSDDVFYLTQQTPKIASGWQQVDLSSRLSSAHGSKPVKAKDFAVSQNLESGKIDMVLVVTAENKDYLYVSLNNDAAIDTITSLSVLWTIMPYDDPDHPNITLQVEHLYIAETIREQYIVADISRRTFAQPSEFLERYYIDPAKSKGRYWRNLPMGGDLDPGIISSLGRKKGDRVDGIYTLGDINKHTELMYVPLYNPFSPDAPPTISRLQVPQGAKTLAVTNIGNNITDLFVTAGKSLYYFAADNQDDGAKGLVVQTNSLFEDAKSLFAFCTADKYVIWGLNRANQIFYTSCLRQNVADEKYWTVPMPILVGVNQVSPYINIADSSNTFFAVAGNELTKATQSPQTGMWSFQDIALKAPADAKAERYSSYTTRIQLTDRQDQLLTDTPLMISTSSKMPVYINGLYYVLTPDAIPVNTDSKGAITVVEEVADIAGVQVFVSDGAGTSVMINPMEKAFNKISALDSADKLRDATIINPDGTTKKLISKDVGDGDLVQVANANTNLAKAYKKVSDDVYVMNRFNRTMPMLMAMPAGNVMRLEGIGDTIVAELGDIFRWLESGVNYVVSLVEDIASGFWRFVVKIGDKIYQGLMDCVEKVLGAVKWIYEAIKTAIEDLIKYLEFLFEWKDITRTKEVFKNLCKLYLLREVDQIAVIKGKFDSEMQKLVKTINDWAGITDWSGLGAAATSPTDASSKPADGQSAPGDLLASHFESNVGSAELKTKLEAPVMGGDKDLIGILFDTLKKEGVILDAVLDQLQKLVSEYKDMSLADILKRIIGIIAAGVLETTQNVIDALFDIVEALARAAIKILDTPIYIPVVSDILEYFGVPTLSMLDILCWIAAVPVTLAYKIGKGEAPFKDDQYTSFLINAKSFEEVQKAFEKPKMLTLSVLQTSPTNAKTVPVTLSVRPDQIFYIDQDLLTAELMAGPISMPDSLSKTIFITGHVFSGFFTGMSAIVGSFEAAAPSGDNEFGTFSAVLGILGAVSNGIAGVLVPKVPIKNGVVSWINTATTGTSVICKIIFSGPAQSKFAASSGIMKNLKVGDGRATGAIVNSILILPALFCSCWHFYELSQTESSSDRSASIIDETSNMTSYISRLSYAVAVNVKEPKVKAISIGIMAVANVCTGGLQMAEAIVGA